MPEDAFIKGSDPNKADSLRFKGYRKELKTKTENNKKKTEERKKNHF